MMDAGMDPFGASASRTVEVELYTGAYRVSGSVRTRFERVTDIVNLLSANHVAVENATVTEYDSLSAPLAAPQVIVALDEVLFLAATPGDSAGRPEMRIPKRAVRAQLGMPPFLLTGSVHVPQGSRPADGLLNSADRYIAMTDVSVACSAHPELDQSVPVLAVQRAKAHLIVVVDDERPEQLLADVLDESTAQGWLPLPRERDPQG